MFLILMIANETWWLKIRIFPFALLQHLISLCKYDYLGDYLLYLQYYDSKDEQNLRSFSLCFWPDEYLMKLAPRIRHFASLSWVL